MTSHQCKAPRHIDCEWAVASEEAEGVDLCSKPEGEGICPFAKPTALAVEDDLKQVERRLESIGRVVCPLANGSLCWSYINHSLSFLREAIGASCCLEDDK